MIQVEHSTCRPSKLVMLCILLHAGDFMVEGLLFHSQSSRSIQEAEIGDTLQSRPIPCIRKLISLFGYTGSRKSLEQHYQESVQKQQCAPEQLMSFSRRIGNAGYFWKEFDVVLQYYSLIVFLLVPGIQCLFTDDRILKITACAFSLRH